MTLLCGSACLPNLLSESMAIGVYRGACPVVVDFVPEIPDDTTAAADSNPDESGTSQPKPVGAEALKLKLALLQKGLDSLQAVAEYTTTFVRQERVCGDLLDRQTVEMKVRHAPFSVYMRWLDGDTGREVLFVNGENNGRMKVKKGGKLGDMLPSINLDPSGSLALAEARHPVTEAGLLNLTELLVTYVNRDLKLSSGVECMFLPDVRIDGRLCHCIKTEYASPAIDESYRCSLTYLDAESGLPLSVRNYGWPAECGAEPEKAKRLTDDTLLESYTFANVRLDRKLSPDAFDTANKDYRFQR